MNDSNSNSNGKRNRRASGGFKYFDADESCGVSECSNKVSEHTCPCTAAHVCMSHWLRRIHCNEVHGNIGSSSDDVRERKMYESPKAVVAASQLCFNTITTVADDTPPPQSQVMIASLLQQHDDVLLVEPAINELQLNASCGEVNVIIAAPAGAAHRET
mmetsp:Transcript_27164/g.38659  ORF Transcript_27164/g.38659 Transcript_27164/m.38659 type:complete len:159 (+) Transcript_27164:156-632(+)